MLKRDRSSYSQIFNSDSDRSNNHYDDYDLNNKQTKKLLLKHINPRRILRNIFENLFLFFLYKIIFLCYFKSEFLVIFCELINVTF